MYKNIMVPLDGSELAERTLPMAIEMASRFDATITLIAVVPGGDAGAEAIRSRLVSAQPTTRPTIELDYAEDSGNTYDPGVASENGQRYLDRVVESVKPRVGSTKTIVTVGDAADEITNAVGREAADIIVMSTRGRSGIVRGLLGSVTDRVLHTAEVPILIVRAETAPDSLDASVTIDSIICPVDGSQRSEAGISHAGAFARGFDSKVVVMHSVGGGPDAMIRAYAPDARAIPTTDAPAASAKALDDAREYVNRITGELKSEGVETEGRVERGNAREQIVRVTDEVGGSMIVMNSRGNTGARRWAFGSVADGVIRTAPVPTLVVRDQ